jgi:hypothetical protein
VAVLGAIVTATLLLRVSLEELDVIRQMVSLSDQCSDSCAQLEQFASATIEAVGGGWCLWRWVYGWDTQPVENSESDWLDYAFVWVTAAAGRRSGSHVAQQAINHAQGQL